MKHGNVYEWWAVEVKRDDVWIKYLVYDNPGQAQGVLDMMLELNPDVQVKICHLVAES